MSNLLENIPEPVKQTIYECISQAIGEDYQSADSHLELNTHISKPFLIWDLIYRNLMNAFGDKNVQWSVTTRGMWTVLLLFEEKSGLLISFMRDARLEAIKKLRKDKQPQYVQSLINLNDELQAPLKQQSIFNDNLCLDGNETELKRILDELCSGFIFPSKHNDIHHALVSFSSKHGFLESLQAYILDGDLDIVCQQDWLNVVRPVLSNEIVTADDNSDKAKLSLKSKATERLKKKELVKLKEKKEEKQA